MSDRLLFSMGGASMIFALIALGSQYSQAWKFVALPCPAVLNE